MNDTLSTIYGTSGNDDDLNAMIADARARFAARQAARDDEAVNTWFMAGSLSRLDALVNADAQISQSVKFTARQMIEIMANRALLLALPLLGVLAGLVTLAPLVVLS